MSRIGKHGRRLEVPCPTCGTVRSLVVASKNDEQYVRERNCRPCSLLVQKVMPTEPRAERVDVPCPSCGVTRSLLNEGPARMRGAAGRDCRNCAGTARRRVKYACAQCGKPRGTATPARAMRCPVCQDCSAANRGRRWASLRAEALEMVDGGMRKEEVARALGRSSRFVERAIARRRQEEEGRQVA